MPSALAAASASPTETRISGTHKPTRRRGYRAAGWAKAVTAWARRDISCGRASHYSDRKDRQNIELAKVCGAGTARVAESP